ncbi:EexN family lipoprotein [Bartonella schoenbuchensis]|uniref:Uncharacterized protein n=1 Tax=Bartonella schoenbuchensis (strain DSM 13525 / NCTC 13165 / R1) TaxID=687861 RepID=E6Z0Q5_BARSR|nr:EexN family lipoprotein [Bartonella schoenbuchensis]AQX31586.1 hypothetical protein BscR1v2_016830 [Bartonella schoenbuchensis R1]CBI82693.1 conserved exported hypothetical protein [Bartonella schoenbuchensis R1]
MNKIIITTLLLCAGLIIAGCEKTYSVEEFKKSEELRGEWDARCGFSGQSKNCQTMRLAVRELEQERQKKADEKYQKWVEEFNKKAEELKKNREEREKAQQERRKKEREEYEKAKQKKESHNE